MRRCLFWLVATAAVSAAAAERKLDFSDVREGQTPAGFRSTVTGKGKPGEWKIVMDEVPPLLPPLTPQAPSVSRRPVLAQLSRDATDEHFPLLILDDDTFGDFTFTTRFKLVDGAAEQMAGLAFRIQDEKNYYYVRASGLGQTFYFFKFVNGQLIGPIGSKVEIGKGVWHELAVECRGSQVTCSLDGKAIISQMQQTTFAKGKVGFWTKSDSLTYFTDSRIVYTPLQAPAQAVVREMVKKYPRLLGLKIFVAGTEPKTTRLIASKDEKELGQPGGKPEADIIDRGVMYYGKDKENGSVSVTMPMRDRNGDIMAAVRVVMKSFPGQTEDNAVVRATPIVKEIQGRFSSLQDLLE